MAAVTTTADRTMKIVGVRRAMSTIIFGDSLPAQTDLTARFGSSGDEVGSMHRFLLHDGTVILPANQFVQAVTSRRACRYTGTGRNRAMRRRMVANSRRGIATSAI